MKNNPIFQVLILAALVASTWTWYESGKGPPEQPIQLVAYNDLTDQERSLIPVSPKDSEVEIAAVDTYIKSMIDSAYTKKLLYKVTFNHTETLLNGNLVLFVDMDKKAIVGRGFDEKKVAFLE